VPTAHLDSVIMLGDDLDLATPRLASQLYQAFDLQLLYRPDMHQVTIHAVITPATTAAIIERSENPPQPPARTGFRIYHHALFTEKSP
jgi:hypothetical protein